MVLVAVTLAGWMASAECYCNRSYSELTVNPGRPLNAVGLLNNGCTAFLIDPNHIVAAAHCFEDTKTGAWATDLRFYLNFHPDRVAANAESVPRADVTRVVVGSRTGESILGAGMDWGIARVDNWQDTAGLDMTPVTLAASLPPVGSSVVNPAYTRYHFPYNDNDSVTWDNMVWDSTNCSWVGVNHGQWTIAMHTAPIYNGVDRDHVECNVRWGAGYIHAGCVLTSVNDGLVADNCDTIGGSSGSPLLYQDPFTGTWSVIGVIHGGGSGPEGSDFAQLTPVCTPEGMGWNAGASVDRFRDAPRFASNVAVHRTPGNPSATAVFAVDSDLNNVVFRTRIGPSPTYTSPFTFWRSLGTPFGGATLTRIAVCSGDSNGDPQVFVVVNGAAIYTVKSLPDGSWGSWTNFGIPPSAGSARDIDATTDSSGRPVLLMVANHGSAYARVKLSDTAWSDWSTILTGTFMAITGLNVDNTTWVGLASTDGKAWLTQYNPNARTTATELPTPAGTGGWRDVDMTWDEAARGFMVAVPTNADDKLWFMPLYGTREWHTFNTRLWAPEAPGNRLQDALQLRSITASRWMEDPAGVTSPVVFATDATGNVYFIEYGRVGTPGWILDWKSFYHETIPY